MLSKKLISTIIAGAATLGISMAANAAVNGPYVGGQLGIADTHVDANNDLGSAASVHDTGLAGRLFGGYQFTQNFAAELGFTQFSNAKINHISGVPGYNEKIRENAVDLVGKGILPLADGFSLYGKAGAALITANPSLYVPASIVGSPVTINGGATSRVYPTFGAGVSYDVTPNVPVDVSWTRIQRVNSGPIQSTDFFGVGIGYNFG